MEKGNPLRSSVVSCFCSLDGSEGRTGLPEFDLESDAELGDAIERRKAAVVSSPFGNTFLAELEEILLVRLRVCQTVLCSKTVTWNALLGDGERVSEFVVAQLFDFKSLRHAESALL